MSVGAAEFRVLVQHRLHVIIPGGDICHFVYWIAEGRAVDVDGMVGWEIDEVNAEELCAIAAYLQARLDAVGMGEDKEHPAGQSSAAAGGRIGDVEGLRGGG